MVLYNRFHHAFWIGSKMFSISLGEGGGVVKFVESRRDRRYFMSCTIDVAAWMKDVLQEIINNDAGKGFKRKFTNSSTTMIAEILVNKGGEFLRFMKVQNGAVRSLVLSGERFKKSWVIMKDRLGIMLGTQPREMPVHNQESLTLSTGKTFRDVLIHNGLNDGKKGWLGGDQNIRKNGVSGGGQGNRRNLSVAEKNGQTKKKTYVPRREGLVDKREGLWERKGKGVMGPLKQWKMAVVVHRRALDWSWEFIESELKGRLSREVEIVPLAADRGVLWCVDEQERKGLVSNGTIFYRKSTIATCEPWRMHSHWDHTQIEAKESWIGIEGLPLVIWNYHVLKLIGDCCGGLMEVAAETMNKTFLLYAKIKVKGFKNGFLSPIIEVPCQGEKIHLGLFSIGSHDTSLNSTGRTGGLLRRSLGNVESKNSSILAFPPMARDGSNAEEEFRDQTGERLGTEVGEKSEQGIREGERVGGEVEEPQSACMTRGKEKGRPTECTLTEVEDEGVSRGGDNEEALQVLKFSNVRVRGPGSIVGHHGHVGLRTEPKPSFVISHTLELGKGRLSSSSLLGSRWRPKKDFVRPAISRPEEWEKRKKCTRASVLSWLEQGASGKEGIKPYPLCYQRTRAFRKQNVSPLDEGKDLFNGLMEEVLEDSSVGEEMVKIVNDDNSDFLEFSDSESTFISTKGSSGTYERFSALGEVNVFNEQMDWGWEDRGGCNTSGEKSALNISPLATVVPGNQAKDKQALSSVLEEAPCIEQELPLVTSNDTIQIGGREVLWSRIREVLASMELQLVKTGEARNPQGGSKSVRRRGRERELRNLEFNIQYDRGVGRESLVINEDTKLEY